MKQRLIVGFTLGPIIVFAVVFNHIALLILVSLSVTVGSLELFNLPKKKGLRPATGFGILFSLALVVASYLSWRAPDKVPPDYFGSLIVLFTLFMIIMFVARMMRGDSRASMANMAVTLFCSVYLGGLLSFVFRLKAMSESYFMVPSGHLQIDYLVMLPFVGAWCSDTAAYFAGVFLGRHKMAPRLSPKKTWEGLVGGIFGNIFAFAVICSALQIPLYHSLGLGAGCAIMGQMGDLAVSAMKREVGAKDMGAILAAHGGFMDRMDSLLLTLPYVYFYFACFVVN